MEGCQCFGKGRACAAGTTEHRQEVATLEEAQSAAQAAQQIAQEKMTQLLPTCVCEVVTGRQPGGQALAASVQPLMRGETAGHRCHPALMMPRAMMEEVALCLRTAARVRAWRIPCTRGKPS